MRTIINNIRAMIQTMRRQKPWVRPIIVARNKIIQQESTRTEWRRRETARPVYQSSQSEGMKLAPTNRHPSHAIPALTGSRDVIRNSSTERGHTRSHRDGTKTEYEMNNTSSENRCRVSFKLNETEDEVQRERARNPKNKNAKAFKIKTEWNKIPRSSARSRRKICSNTKYSQYNNLAFRQPVDLDYGIYSRSRAT